jgi:hypothetical protein
MKRSVGASQTIRSGINKTAQMYSSYYSPRDDRKKLIAEV